MLIEPQCSKRKCSLYLGTKNFKAEKDKKNSADGVRNVCLAFPNGIPDEIAYGDNKHSKPFKGQEGEFVYTKED